MTAPGEGSPRGSALAPLVGVALLVFGFLPIANWIPGGHEAPWYGVVAGEWLTGSAIAIGVGVVAAILTRGRSVGVRAWWERVASRAARAPGRTGALLALAAGATYALIAVAVFDRRPLLIDEVSQLFQARTFAAGQLWRAAPAFPEFVSIPHLLLSDGKWVSQFPPGGSLVLVPGVLLGAPWLVNPVLGAVSVALFWGIARRIEGRGEVALGAAVLFALAPFVAFMAGSHMNHVPALACMLGATYALARQVGSARVAPLAAAAAGACLGVMATVRPVDAVAFALPAGAWMLWRAWREPARWREVVAAGAALAIPLAALLWYNARTTGSPLLFAYEKLWGADHGLGFHRAPWGFAHTPARGLELVSLYVLRLQTYLFEAGIPSLLPAAAALLAVRRAGALDRYWLVAGVGLVGAYFAYWHNGFYLGPRFTYLLAPALALWTARAPGVVAERLRLPGQGRTAVGWTLGAAVLVGVVANVPFRARQYREGLASMRLDFTAPARDLGVVGALIFVRDSWGSQILARLWSVGVPMSAAENLYRSVDICVLDRSLTVLERSGIRGVAAESTLVPLQADSGRVIRSTISPDETEHVLPGSTYAGRCMRRILEDRAGFTLLTPLAVQDWAGNVYARDLHGRDSVLIARYPDRPVYLMYDRNGDADGKRGRKRLSLERVDLDSARAAWRADARDEAR